MFNVIRNAHEYLETNEVKSIQLSQRRRHKPSTNIQIIDSEISQVYICIYLPGKRFFTNSHTRELKTAQRNKEF